ncbi:MAG: phosphatidylglycerophosphatase A [Desulfobacterales bacterium]
MKIAEKSIVFLATGGYIGLIPMAPGTFGSILGLPLSYLISQINLWYGILFMSIAFVSAVFISNEAEKYMEVKDPGSVIIDEVIGLMAALWGLPFNAYTALTGFILFRFFDIAKPFPIKRIEMKLTGGWGITLDDVLAGFYANLVLRVGLWAIGNGP